MKNIAIILTLCLALISCKNDKKEEQNSQEPIFKEIETNDSAKPTKQYPKVDKTYNGDMSVIFNKGYLFDEEIQLDEIDVIQGNAENTYDLILFFNDATTVFETLEKYKIGLVLYPKDPSKLKSAKDKAAKKIKFGKPAVVKMFDEEYVIVLDNIKVVPKDFAQIKLYFYDSKGALNDNFLRFSNVVFP